jgi:hypothetical protein
MYSYGRGPARAQSQDPLASAAVHQLHLGPHQVPGRGDHVQVGEVHVRDDRLLQREVAGEDVVDRALDASLSIPSPLVAFPCGSVSMTSVFFSATARQAPRLMAVVVFPTPPFWLAIAMIRDTRVALGVEGVAGPGNIPCSGEGVSSEGGSVPRGTSGTGAGNRESCNSASASAACSGRRPVPGHGCFLVCPLLPIAYCLLPLPSTYCRTPRLLHLHHQILQVARAHAGHPGGLREGRRTYPLQLLARLEGERGQGGVRQDRWERKGRLPPQRFGAVALLRPRYPS